MPKTKTKKLKIKRSRQCLVETLQKPPNKKLFCLAKTLDRALSSLKKLNRRRKKETNVTCKTRGLTEGRIDDQVKLRCRQLPNVVHELRKSIMRQDWDEVATLLMILCHPGLKLYISIIFRTCFLLLFNHPNSSLELLINHLRNTTGYIRQEDLFKFIRILFAIRKTPLMPLKSGKYIRKGDIYKITRDVEFQKLNEPFL